MSGHFDNRAMDSSDYDEDSNPEVERSQGGRSPPARRGREQDRGTRLQDLTPPTARPTDTTGGARPADVLRRDKNRNSIALSREVRGIQIWVLVILIVALCASLCHSLAFASENWMQDGGSRIGLWMDCNCTTYTPGGDLSKWLLSSKVFLGIALVVAVGTALTIPVYNALETSSKKNMVADILYKCIDATLLLILFGCLPVGVLFDRDHKLGVGFSLCMVAALLCIPKNGLLAVKGNTDFLYRFNWLHAAISLYYLITVHFLLVCYVTSSWASSADQHVGLWTNCVCEADPFKDDENSNTLKAIQAMITVGEILLLVNVIIMAVLAGMPMTNDKRTALITAIHIICFAAGITTIIAVVMFATGIKEGYSLGYSFVFSILSALFCIIAACIAVLRRSSERNQTRPMSSA